MIGQEATVAFCWRYPAQSLGKSHLVKKINNALWPGRVDIRLEQFSGSRSQSGISSCELKRKTTAPSTHRKEL
jgi:hypothetical protein